MQRLRTAIFWAHLGVGIAVGLVVLSMSATGVILTFERQILRAIDDSTETSPGQALPADRLIEAALAAAEAPDDASIALRFSSTERSPVLASHGRSQQFLLDPATGAVLRTGPSAAGEFFSLVTRLHRWFALEGDARNTARAVTGVANLGFLFLLLTGIYLWLPKLWNRVVLRTQVLFQRRYPTGKARDWAWHRIFGFWAAVPLFFIISTATFFYFSWPVAMLYGYFGEPVPERGQQADSSVIARLPVDTDDLVQRMLDTGVALAHERGIDWRTLTVEAAPGLHSDVVVRFDETVGGRPQTVSTLTLASGQPPAWQTLADRTPASQTRFIIRFLHTGEVLGVPGQTIAGFASLAGCVLVWTGLALAWRRLMRPLRRTRSQKSPA